MWEVIHHPATPAAVVIVVWLLMGQLIKRRHRKMRAEERYATGALRARVMDRDGHRCVQCGHEGSFENPLQVDHVKPWSRGGKTVIGNLQVLCRYHNMKKGDTYHGHDA